jgi:hypothetical protein
MPIDSIDSVDSTSPIARSGSRNCVLVSLLWLATAISPHFLGAQDTLRIQATPVRVADAKCAKCHGEIYRKYLATPMADASGLAAEKLIADSYVHGPSGAE